MGRDVRPFMMSSAINSPTAGAMANPRPQKAVATKKPASCFTEPMIGRKSGVHTVNPVKARMSEAPLSRGMIVAARPAAMRTASNVTRRSNPSIGRAA